MLIPFLFLDFGIVLPQFFFINRLYRRVLPMVGAVVFLCQNPAEILAQLHGAAVVQMQARVIGIGLEIQADILHRLSQVIVGQAVLRGVGRDLGIVLLVPIGIEAGVTPM